MMLDNRWQMQLNGLLMGSQTYYRFATAPEGLGAPAPRISDLSWLVDDGVYAAGDYMEARTINATLVIVGNSRAHTETLAHALAAAWAPSRTERQLLLRIEDGRTYLLNGRPRRCELDLSGLKSGIARAAVSFLAVDPLMYDSEQQSATLAQGAGTLGGTTPPIVFPLVFQASGTQPGVALLSNAGTATTFPTITITGPATNPFLQNLTTGETITFTRTLISTDVLIADCRAKTITVNGTSTLGAFTIGSSWLSLAAGSNQITHRSADGTATASTATVTWRSAWY